MLDCSSDVEPGITLLVSRQGIRTTTMVITTRTIHLCNYQTKKKCPSRCKSCLSTTTTTTTTTTTATTTTTRTAAKTTTTTTSTTTTTTTTTPASTPLAPTPTPTPTTTAAATTATTTTAAAEVLLTKVSREPDTQKLQGLRRRQHRRFRCVVIEDWHDLFNWGLGFRFSEFLVQRLL